MFKYLIVVSILLSCFAMTDINASNSEQSFTDCDVHCQNLAKNLKKYARNGSPKAQLLLGMAYKTGELFGVVDPDVAWKWMNRSKRQLYAPALYAISNWYRYGYETEIDIERADNYLVRSADKNYSPAMLELGIIYLQRNKHEEGQRLITKAAEKGYSKAIKLQKRIDSKTITQKSDLTLSIDVASKNAITDNSESVEEVITVLGQRPEPMILFELLIDNIKNERLYTEKGTTGSRMMGAKCGKGARQCKVIYPLDN